MKGIKLIRENIESRQIFIYAELVKQKRVLAIKIFSNTPGSFEYDGSRAIRSSLNILPA